MSRKIGGYIETYMGKSFWPLDPDAEDVDIRDIAHSLSLKCRFNGQCREFYSVAQHSVFVANALASYSHWYRDWLDAQLVALLHDAGEAYLCDIPSPVKEHLIEFKEIEDKIMQVVHAHFHLDIESMENVSTKFLGANLSLTKDIKTADKVALATEARDLMRNFENWNFQWVPLDTPIIPLSPRASEKLFLDKFYELKG